MLPLAHTGITGTLYKTRITKLIEIILEGNTTRHRHKMPEKILFFEIA